ncbi:SIS domain-containing protein [Ahrensia sp. 13_GOM-1096m]|uniref:SIS domain-containing protein n=1 Tax=Ahrensia sp. 13_GOM-1096m TaxID=1380380 RepID=UPI0006849647|nr:SIS domain-containing protein [Ahrensia sp. 13_GOM-1096m]
MCGIAGFISNEFSTETADLKWLLDLTQNGKALPDGVDAAGGLSAIVTILEQRFSDLMSIATLRAVALNADIEDSVRTLSEILSTHEKALTALSQAGRTDLDPLIESLRDYGWQLHAELADHAKAAEKLVSKAELQSSTALHVAIAAEYVLRSIDRLEVRGRDSAGIAIQIDVDENSVSSMSADLKTNFDKRRKDTHAGDMSIYQEVRNDGGISLTFVYKTANLVGRLGDNGAALRASIAGDAVFWSIAANAKSASILSHTRWASHGVISVANCHPHNPSLTSDLQDSTDTQLGAMYALNGDVDNHMELLEEFVTKRDLAVDTAITTDAKIIPITDRVSANMGNDRLEQFRAATRRLDGSVAIGCIDPFHPSTVFLAQKGSGQGLHAARLNDGWIFASEVYGLCNAALTSYNLARSVAGGSVIKLVGGSDTIDMRTVSDGKSVEVKSESNQIFARDIYRGAYDHFLEKEINDGPSSVAKTLRGRYRREGSFVAFNDLPTDIWQALRENLKGGLSRVYVIGQGTAGVAAVGIGHLIEKALGRDARRKVPVMAIRSSELSADIEAYNFDRALVIAVSQSGTTTDTNRAVDLARERGAFVHAIVNRRNSDLVRKADSALFTSDGRDVEMSVASTKAFYSQITAGKLTAMFLADQLQTMTDVELAYEIGELEKLPAHVASVLANEAHIAECAQSLAPYARYWAVTGSGVNHVAALEIRIKLSELCYKSIPVDYTEDKKHIDLSTEPLTLVIANDLPGDLVGDVVKEAAIFKAHNGRPIVFATEGADAEAFGDYAERVIALPKIGADLAFVLATVAGHLFGFHAARAIDVGAQKLKLIMVELEFLAMGDANANVDKIIDMIDAFTEEAIKGAFNSGLGASHTATIANIARKLMANKGDEAALKAIAEAASEPIRKAFEETSRPIDTIRHQAKTVTVGTSRPEDALSPAVRDALGSLALADSRLSFDNRKTLASVSRVIDSVRWVALMDLTQKNDGMIVKAPKGAELPQAIAAYQDGKAPIGVVGAALDTRKLTCGYINKEAVVAVPVTGLHSAEIDHVLCIAVDMVAHASREQKTAIMHVLETYQHTLRQWEQTFGTDAEANLQRQIARTNPETVLFHPSAIDPLLSDENKQTA